MKWYIIDSCSIKQANILPRPMNRMSSSSDAMKGILKCLLMFGQYTSWALPRVGDKGV